MVCYGCRVHSHVSCSVQPVAGGETPMDRESKHRIRLLEYARACRDASWGRNDLGRTSTGRVRRRSRLRAGPGPQPGQGLEQLNRYGVGTAARKALGRLSTGPSDPRRSLCPPLDPAGQAALEGAGLSRVSQRARSGWSRRTNRSDRTCSSSAAAARGRSAISVLSRIREWFESRKQPPIVFTGRCPCGDEMNADQWRTQASDVPH
jgi:hypothetical protein